MCLNVRLSLPDATVLKGHSSFRVCLPRDCLGMSVRAGRLPSGTVYCPVGDGEVTATVWRRGWEKDI